MSDATPEAQGLLDPASAPQQHHGACAVHPQDRAVFACARCGNFGCAACLFSHVEGAQTCTACAAQGLGEPIPWERRKQIGWWRAFLETSRLASRQPERFFKTPTTEAGIGGPMLYGAAAYTFGQIVYALQLSLLLCVSGGGAALAGQKELGAVFGIYGGALGVCAIPVLIIQAPLYAVIGTLLASGLTHGTLALFKKTQAPFEQTFRALAYSNAPYFYYWIPCIGPFVSFVWMLLTEVQAVRALHRVTADRAWIAVLGYRILLLAILFVVYAGLIVFAIAMSPERPD